MAVTALDKDLGEWCVHCNVGSGCAIYESRPGECRTFACQWLITPQMPDSMRPDRTKVVLTTMDANFNLVAYCDPAYPLAWRKEPTYSLLKSYAQQGLGQRWVTVRVGGSLWLVMPNEDVDLGRIPAGVPISLSKGADGKYRAIVSPPVA